MNYTLIIILLAAFTCDVALIAFSISRKDNSRSMYFTLLILALASYTMGCILAQMSSSAESISNALRVVSVGLPLIGPCFLIMILNLFLPNTLKPWMLTAALSYGLIAFISSVFIFDIHYDVLVSVYADGSDIAEFINVEPNVMCMILQITEIICMAAASIILIIRFIKGSKKFKKQTVYILAGVIFMLLSNIIMNILISNYLQKLNVLPVLMTVMLIFFFFNMSACRLLDIESIIFNTAIDTMSDAIVIADNDWEFLFCNKSAKILFPSLNSVSEGDSVTKIKELPAEFIPAVSPCKKTFTLMGNKENRENRENRENSEDDKAMTYWANINKISDRKNENVGWSIIIHDTTDMTFLINQLADLATTDSLTGISNRRYFLERVHRELEMSARLNLSNALIMYDIDCFKNINDTYGHVAGDRVLCEIVDTVKKQLRSYDIIGRYGGEEFVIFTTSTEEDALYKFVLRLCKAVESARIIYEGKIIAVTASFGAVQIHPGNTFDEAMLAVDTAMYNAKHNGKNRVVVGVIPEKNKFE